MIYPNQFHIELTQRCNLRCIHCFANASEYKTNELSYNDVISIYKSMSDLGMIYANLSGGEPFLNKDFFEIIKYAVGQPFGTCVLTNGVLWTDDAIDKLCEIDPERRLTIQISLDGPYEIMAKERLLSLEQYQKIIDTIIKLKRNGFKVGCLIVINSITAVTSIDTIKYAIEELKVDAVQAIPLFPTGRANDNRTVLQNFWNEWNRFVVDITQIKKEKLWGENSNKVNIGFFTLYEMTYPLDSMGMHEDIMNIWGLDLTSEETFTKQTRRTCFCEAGQTELTISSDKKVYPCVAALRTVFGGEDIEGEAIEDIWKKSEKLNFFRNVKEKVICKEPCRSCGYRNICGGGCRVAAYELLKDKYAPDPRCPIVQEYLAMNQE